MSVSGQNHTMVEKETKVFTVDVVDQDDGAAVDLTSATITWRVKEGSTTKFSKTVGSGITLTSPTTGRFTITLATGDTSGLSGQYEHECRATLSDGTITTLFTGRLVVQPTLIP